MIKAGVVGRRSAENLDADGTSLIRSADPFNASVTTYFRNAIDRLLDRKTSSCVINFDLSKNLVRAQV
jgi:hypothetical protein